MSAEAVLNIGKPRQTRKRVEGVLREMILDGRLPAGSQLMQHALARELGASVNLVREVLMDLRTLGLVASQPGIGFTVRELTVEGFMDAAEVRAVLDGLAARLCCRRATRDDIARLKAIVDQMRRECLARTFDDRGPAHLMDRDLHDGMFTISGSDTLIRAMQSCWIPMISVDNPSPEYQKRYDESYQEHLAIIGAIEEDRPDDAERLAREHRRTGMRRVQEEAKRGNVQLGWH